MFQGQIGTSRRHCIQCLHDDTQSSWSHDSVHAYSFCRFQFNMTKSLPIVLSLLKLQTLTVENAPAENYLGHRRMRSWDPDQWSTKAAGCMVIIKRIFEIRTAATGVPMLWCFQTQSARHLKPSRSWLSNSRMMTPFSTNLITACCNCNLLVPDVECQSACLFDLRSCPGAESIGLCVDWLVWQHVALEVPDSVSDKLPYSERKVGGRKRQKHAP